MGACEPLRIVSWNVNGLRSILGKGFRDFAHAEGADAFCLQEVRALPTQVGEVLPGYDHLWHPAAKPGYSGTLVLTRVPPLRVVRDMPFGKDEAEGRVLTCEYPSFYLVTVYTPNARHGLTRLRYRQAWDEGFLAYLQDLRATKGVVFCGDLNVAHEERDLARPEDNRGNPGFTDEERAGFSSILGAGFLDTFRLFSAEGGHYTWWSYRGGARRRNIGWRIDYCCVSGDLKPRVAEASILSEVGGSDHCPVRLVLAPS
ncbi:MAG: exodeoxyribonuclease III [Deltaproteobacteria bacterium RIFOXYA12_FULL_61_11]|nr:MAG: exodeoxyribonuclease III [Deltaproteobacteria bacterium RIFOXYA12_FULL_61_11]